MFAKDHEKHAKQINEEKECDMKSTSTKISMGVVETKIIPRHAKERRVYLEHSSSSQEIKIDEGASDDSTEERNSGHDDINKFDGEQSNDNNSILYNPKQTNISDEHDIQTSSLAPTQSTMLRSKSFMSLVPKNELFKARSSSKQYSSSINLAQVHLIDEDDMQNNELEKDFVNRSMKPPIHPPLSGTKFGISRKNGRKHWSLDNGSQHTDAIESSKLKTITDSGRGVQLRREKTQIISSATKLQNRLSWNNNSLKMSKLHGGSTNSLIEFMPTDNAQAATAGLSLASSVSPSTSMLDICAKELGNKSGCRSGYLNLKKNTGFKTYKKYWCVVDESEGLFYICSKDSKKIKQAIPLGGCLVAKDSSTALTPPGTRESSQHKEKKKNVKHFDLIPPPSVEKNESSSVSQSNSTRPKSESNAIRTLHSQTISKRISFITNTGEETDDWVQSFKAAIDRSSKKLDMSFDTDVTDSVDSTALQDIQRKHKSLQPTPNILVKQISRNLSEHEDLVKNAQKSRRERSGFLRRPKSSQLEDDIETNALERRDSWHGRGEEKSNRVSVMFRGHDSDQNDKLLDSPINIDQTIESDHLNPDTEHYKTWHGSR
jgi:hypothetical protein